MSNIRDWSHLQKERQKTLQKSGKSSAKTIFVSKWLYITGFILIIALPTLALGVYFYQQNQKEAAVVVIGNTITVKNGGDFQSALNRAKSGDTILLEAGATFKGNFILPAKQGNEFITIRSSAPDSQLPPNETRIDPKKYAAFLPKILTNSSDPAISTEKNSHHYRFIGIEISSASDKYVYNLVMLGDEKQTANETPHHFEFDRCYIHPNQNGKSRRGIALNNSETIIKNSYIAGFAYREEETQAIAGWFGPGPYKIINNYLEAGAENIMFGGSPPQIKGLVPSDIEISRNYMTKPLEWRGKLGTKCTFELKNARRVTVSGNIIENSFEENAIRLTVRGENSVAPWSTIEDVVIENNIIRNSGGGVNLLGVDDSGKSETMKRVKINNNLFIDLDTKKWGGDGRFITVSDGEDISVTNNTVFQSGNIITAHGNPSKRFIFRDNIVAYNDYGYFGDKSGVGQKALEMYLPNSIFTGNVIVNSKNLPKQYMFIPPQNLVSQDFQTVGFMNLPNGDFKLSSNSIFKGKGMNGKDSGVDFSLIEKAIGANPLR